MSNMTYDEWLDLALEQAMYDILISNAIVDIDELLEIPVYYYDQESVIKSYDASLLDTIPSSDLPKNDTPVKFAVLEVAFFDTLLPNAHEWLRKHVDLLYEVQDALESIISPRTGAFDSCAETPEDIAAVVSVAPKMEMLLMREINCVEHVFPFNKERLGEEWDALLFNRSDLFQAVHDYLVEHPDEIEYVLHQLA